jgi:Domain of unknown function (DUF4124)
MQITCRLWPRALPFLMLATMLAMAALPAHAQWKWRDKNGQITASDLPPPRDVADKDVLQRPDLTARRAPTAAPVAASGAASAPRAAVDPQLEARKRAGEQEQQAKVQADEERLKAQRADNCRSARGHAAALESGQRIARTNEKGEREVLDDKGRAEEMRRARESIASNCK